MAKLGRHKKEILESIDLEEWHKFQSTLTKNVGWIGAENLSSKENAFLNDFLVDPEDDIWDKTVKALRFKHYILHKDLTHDECSYFIDVDKKGTKPTKSKRLTKMSICKIEMKACEKLRKALGSKFNIFNLSDVLNTGKSRANAGIVDFEKRSNGYE